MLPVPIPLQSATRPHEDDRLSSRARFRSVPEFPPRAILASDVEAPIWTRLASAEYSPPFLQ